jgi:hypothetical protein
MKAKYLILLAITVMGAALRAPLLNIGLTIDDACSANVVESSDLVDMFERIRVYEMSPPLYFLVLKAFAMLFGFNSITMALPSFIFGVLSIPTSYFLALRLTEPSPRASQAASVCAFFTAVSPLAIIYSHEARTYALAGLLLSWTIIAFWQFLTTKCSWRQAVPLFLSSTALVYTHYTGIFYLCILMLTAVIAAVKSNTKDALRALPPMLLACAALLPWLPILLYHKNVGTPWADPTPLSNFLYVFAGNLAATMPLPVVPAYLLLIIAVPIALIAYIVTRGKAALNNIKMALSDIRIIGLVSILAFSCASFGYVTPYMFGYVRYLSPLVPLSSALLALLVVRTAQTKINRALLIALLISGLSGAIWEVQQMASLDRSGLRQVAQQIKAGSFGDSVYITAPDFTGMILTYYLKHECGYKDETLPTITGFACPESGKRPVKHEEDVQWWQRQGVIDLQMELLKKEQAKGAKRLIFIRDTYRPSSKLMPTREISDALEARLKQTYKAQPPVLYKGRANSYEVTQYDLQN